MMNENINNVNDLIYLFLDGEITGTQQKVLFEALPNDPELQTELQHAHEIRKAFEVEKESVYPSRELTNTVFQRAGFSSGGTVVQPVPGKFAQILGSSLWTKYRWNVFSFVMGALLTGTMIYYGTKQSIQRANSVQPVKETAEVGKTIISPEQKNSITNEISKTTSSVNKQKTKIIYVYLDKVNNNNTKTDITEPVNNVQENVPVKEEQTLGEKVFYPKLKQNKIQLADFSNTIDLSYLNKVSVPRFSIVPDEFALRSKNTDEKLFEAELKGISGFSYLPNRTIEVMPKPFLNNYSIGFRMFLDKNHSFAIKIGNEDFQMYKLDWNGNIPVFTLESALLWAGVGYKYQFGNLFGNLPIQPFGELLGGLSKYGPLLKGSLGLSYNPDNTFEFSLGLEGTEQAYVLLQKYHHAQKFAVFYSVGYKF